MYLLRLHLRLRPASSDLLRIGFSCHLECAAGDTPFGLKMPAAKWHFRRTNFCTSDIRPTGFYFPVVVFFGSSSQDGATYFFLTFFGVRFRAFLGNGS
jgi:hypothetical protein